MSLESLVYKKHLLGRRCLEILLFGRRCDSLCCSWLQEAGLEKLVEYNRKKQEEVHLQELKGSLAESITADPPLPVPESIRIVQDAKKEWQLPDTEIIKVPASAPPA